MNDDNSKQVPETSEGQFILPSVETKQPAAGTPTPNMVATVKPKVFPKKEVPRLTLPPRPVAPAVKPLSAMPEKTFGFPELPMG